MKTYHWALLGAGTIASEMADALKQVNGGIHGVAASRPESARRFADTHGVTRAYGSYEEMLSDPEIDIIYIATPHNLHYDNIKQALEAGKHVLCEKAITVNGSQLEELASLAGQKNLVLMEAMTIYHMPLYKRLREIAESGAIGPVKMIQVNFGSCKEYDVKNRFFSKELAGGALLDIGVYAAAFARYFLTERPDQVLTMTKYFETGVDEQSGIILKNSRDEMAVMALTMRAKQPKRGVIAGEDGYIEVSDYPRAEKATITYTKDGRTEELVLGEKNRALEYEVLDMQASIENQNPEETLAYSRDVMYLLTEVRRQWGMTYPFE